MDDWALPTIAAIVLAYAATSRGLSRAAITPAIYFTVAGLVAGWWLGLIEPGSEGSEAPRRGNAHPRALRRRVADLGEDAPGELAVPVRLLGIGLPLTIVAGTLAGFGVLPGLTFVEALVLSTMLACTDAALGQAVVTDERVPSRIRQGLNVESGLNDGLCVPLFLIALAVAEAEDEALTGRQALHIVVEEIGYGALGGIDRRPDRHRCAPVRASARAAREGVDADPHGGDGRPRRRRQRGARRKHVHRRVRRGL